MRREGELCELFWGVEGRKCKAACLRAVATGVRFGGYALLAFGEISKRQMASFDVGGFVDLLWSLRCLESRVGGVCVHAASPEHHGGSATVDIVRCYSGAGGKSMAIKGGCLMSRNGVKVATYLGLAC